MVGVIVILASVVGDKEGEGSWEGGVTHTPHPGTAHKQGGSSGRSPPAPLARERPDVSFPSSGRKVGRCSLIFRRHLVNN